MEENSGISWAIGKTITGFLAPAYISLFLFLYLLGLPFTSEEALKYFFFATLMALALSSIQLYLVKILVRPMRAVLYNYTTPALDPIYKESVLGNKS